MSASTSRHQSLVHGWVDHGITTDDNMSPCVLSSFAKMLKQRWLQAVCVLEYCKQHVVVVCFTSQALRSAERAQRSSARMRDEGTDEIERVRCEMLDRMKELQPLPQLLKVCYCEYVCMCVWLL